MRIVIVTPARRGLRAGNRITSLRYAALLRGQGHEVRVRRQYGGEENCDVLFALHAVKSAEAIRRSRAEAPERPIVLVLTGTDLYGEIDEPDQWVETLSTADRLVVLQPRALDRIPPSLRPQTHVILQSARPPQNPEPPDERHFDVCVIAHLRPIKDPLLTARAARLLPGHSRVRVLHVGRALDDEYRAAAEEERLENPRFHWLGAQRHGETLATLARSHLLAVTSVDEGGPTVVTEAVACGVGVLSTHTPAAVGLLGSDHPGLFPRGDARALADLLRRCEEEAPFLASLRARSVAAGPSVAPRREAADLRALLEAL